MSVCTLKTTSGLEFAIDADNPQELVEKIASIQEIFDNSCTRCDHGETRFVVRTDDEDNKYYEMRCTNPKCRAKLAFGCNKKGGGLFPKRYDKDGNMIGQWGWGIWDKDKGEVV